KRTLACSSISQIGFILVGTAMMCLLGEHNALAVDGTILHILNHSLIKMVLFPLAGIIHLSTHSFDLNEIRGFGRGKPLLALLMGLPMLSLAGVPALNGYVSKTLLHESIVEYIPLAGEYDLLFSALEGLFLFSGGLTLAYMLKLFVCLFVEKNPLPQEVLDKKWRRRGEHYIAPVSLGAVACYLLVMVRLGSEPNVTMDAVAAMTRGFLHGHAPDHPVDYFSPVNLEGAGISLAIGVIVYVLVVRLLLVRKKRYFDPIPPGLNLEYGLYRPLLDLLTKTAVVLATLVDRLLPRLLFQALPRWIGRIHQDGVECWEGAVRRLTGGRYAPQPSVEQAADDEYFARYEDAPRRGGGFVQSLAFGLILTGLGMAFALLFILLYGIHV
ncbi:MAG: sodium:proton antiporter, partial [Oscillospiraceae bacterium]|nr:sodium:proton antiporter [Oscillospiraceae bacterium]